MFLLSKKLEAFRATGEVVSATALAVPKIRIDPLARLAIRIQMTRHQNSNSCEST